VRKNFLKVTPARAKYLSLGNRKSFDDDRAINENHFIGICGSTII